MAGRKAYLFAFIGDHSPAVVGHRWGYFEDSVRLAAALRPALAARGVPESIYVDNGSAFVDVALKRAAARLGALAPMLRFLSFQMASQALGCLTRLLRGHFLWMFMVTAICEWRWICMAT
ncbi:Integrase core domain-containing protein [Nonomuraea jiangxiensis]|uniref:Integrase core domain-containing protein n=2 Tax=Nonomuraea jiangxiensis TaxID=633440 RepID=A0A1G9QNB7_9ACTN|nr:Integrase core domain-containing protein [Nonomuraea jiangxiensis]